MVPVRRRPSDAMILFLTLPPISGHGNQIPRLPTVWVRLKRSCRPSIGMRRLTREKASNKGRTKIPAQPVHTFWEIYSLAIEVGRIAFESRGS